MFRSPEKYTGRFAPSPTGPLHFGSLVAAVASYLDARSRNGSWIVRMEDLDRPRAQPGAAGAILRSLEDFGFEWDGPVLFQSCRSEVYLAAFEKLLKAGALYACGCTRKEVADSNVGASAEQRYPGTCRSGLQPGKTPRSWRLRVASTPVSFEDRVQGVRTQDILRYCGDFIVKRADGLFAYQLAVVVDDYEQRVTDVVRGADLLDSTPRQIYLQGFLGAPRLRYLHTPVALNEAGEKLSKQTLAPAIHRDSAVLTLIDALAFLGQRPPAEMREGSLSDLWTWAVGNWSPDRIPRIEAAPAPDAALSRP